MAAPMKMIVSSGAANLIAPKLVTVLLYLSLNLSKDDTRSVSTASLRSQLDSIGTKVCDNKNEAIMANPTDKDKGINMALGTPVINKAGRNTTRTLNRIRSLGVAISRQASRIARDLDLSIC